MSDARSPLQGSEPECERCEDTGTYMDLADCTTFGSDCACNGPRVERVCPDCFVPRTDAEALAEALKDIADGFGRHNPGWWIKGAKRSLAAYRAKHPTSVGMSGDATTKPASELERGPKETT